MTDEEILGLAEQLLLGMECPLCCDPTAMRYDERGWWVCPHCDAIVMADVE